MDFFVLVSLGGKRNRVRNNQLSLFSDPLDFHNFYALKGMEDFSIILKSNYNDEGK